VKGLTTGACMWLSGPVGVACAFGYCVITFAVRLTAAILLGVVGKMEMGLNRGKGD
jgi:putative Mg2+ transporter-C (MgtC) family protein